MRKKMFSGAGLTWFNALALMPIFSILGCASFDNQVQERPFMDASLNANQDGLEVTSPILELKPLALSIDGERGARIASLTWNGQQVLSGKEVHQDNWGFSVQREDTHSRRHLDQKVLVHIIAAPLPL